MPDRKPGSRVEFRKIALPDTGEARALCGELPACSGRRWPSRYYRHLEQTLRRRLEAVPEPCALLLRTTLYSPAEMICSVRIEAQLRCRERTFPFFQDGCVWDLRSGFPLGFRALAGQRFSVRRLWGRFEPRREPEWLLRAFPDWETKTKKALSRYRFYLEPDTLVFYLPPGLPGVLPDSACRLPFPGK